MKNKVFYGKIKIMFCCSLCSMLMIPIKANASKLFDEKGKKLILSELYKESTRRRPTQSSDDSDDDIKKHFPPLFPKEFQEKIRLNRDPCLLYADFLTLVQCPDLRTKRLGAIVHMYGQGAGPFKKAYEYSLAFTYCQNLIYREQTDDAYRYILEFASKTGIYSKKTLGFFKISIDEGNTEIIQVPSSASLYLRVYTGYNDIYSDFPIIDLTHTFNNNDIFILIEKLKSGVPSFDDKSNKE